MDFDLTDEQLELRASIRRYLDTEVAPAVDAHERAGTFPYEVLEGLREFGYLGGWLPEELGGFGMSRVTWAMMIEQLGYCWPSLRTMVNICNGPIERIARYGSEEHKERYLGRLFAGTARPFNGYTEPDVGSNVAGVRTKAVLDGDSWVLEGRKAWITGGAWAEFGIVLARTYSPTCEGGLSLFVVDKADSPFEVRPQETMVLRCTGTAELLFDGVRVPRENLLGAEGNALKAALTGLGAARINVAMGAVGAAQRAFDLALDYARTREQFGQPIGRYQLVQKHLVDMKIRIEAARALSYLAADAIDKGRPARLEGSIAKLYATEAAHEVADMALQVHGASGYASDYPIERIFRDTRGGTIPEGTTEMQTLIIGRELVGMSAIGGGAK
ncbi:acyl-CoA dehydrogenase family protein [Pseudonocardia kunmingensis]|uniref:Alkylation response protein AidB-like acyl-CoA dehydrogenase n=1 Tax=Pseudonocardia kunmingensis TaxID=630975 RepID=A0A543CXY0_9PSEU|nr:acyl-CoA dehydrogenase family protein [Pseudonocardia kunmingensis]TQM01940.1 alkylation response protein AidB-like acyl-CoA dehydrogenase [Pseudonocardia kunmingensis]